METEFSTGSINKASGIPRPSKLPLLRNRPTQVSLAKEEDAVEASKSTRALPKVPKRRSIASLPRPGVTGAKQTESAAKRTIPKNNVSTGIKHVPNSSVSSRTSSVRSSSRGKPPLSLHGPKSSSKDDEQEVQDQLSSLDAYHASSRPSSRPGSRDESPTEQTDADATAVVSGRSKSSRPSLSNRTIESIQNLPSTPKDRRRSSFFSPVESPMGPPPRPASSLSRNGTNGTSRPGTSDGNFAKPFGKTPAMATKLPASAKSASRTSLGGFGFTPQRSVSNSSKGSQLRIPASVPPSPGSPSPSKKAAPAPIVNGARSVKTPSISKATPRTKPKPSPSISDAFGSAILAGAASSPPAGGIESASQAPTPRSAKRVASNASSAALRQQIAAAKAAARKEKSTSDSTHDEFGATNVDSAVGLHADPFNQVPRDDKHILRNRINAARMDGKLNIAAMSLKEIPDEVLKMYDAEAMEESKVSWAEVVDLTRLNAADNEIEDLTESVFPDVSPEDPDMDDQTTVNQFGGLESLDLHGNKLSAIPMGMRRLQRLTSLNLSHNSLENASLDIISQIESLKELKLGFNNLSGTLPTIICNLQNLETLDLQCNRLLVLPEALRELVFLKALNVSGNQLTTLPMEALQELNLTELDASGNALIGALFPASVDASHPTLRSLKVANNSLAAITFAESLSLPQLQTLDVTNNHLTVLPSLSEWVELTTLLASDNKIAELPPGFVGLRKLRNVNFTSNELRLLEPAIARMDALESLLLAANPLREKKFLTMNAADIKRDLQARLEPSQAEDDDLMSHEDFHDARDSFSSPPRTSDPTTSWTFKSNGELDLARRGLFDDIDDTLGTFLQRNEVKSLHLSSNKLTVVPRALSFSRELRSLDLSGNSLSSAYLTLELELLSLQHLNISRCGITTLEPLTTHLRVPNLKELNLTVNRLTGPLPTLRMTYPVLTTLLAGDNRFTSVTAESLRGLQTVNLASNNIEQLPAEVGLLWDQGLRNLDIGSNAFRVPNYRILEKGTEATLRYLRDRIPAARSPSTVNGNGGSEDEVD